MEKAAIEHPSTVMMETAKQDEVPITAYAGDHVTDSGTSSKVERSLFWKSMGLIVVLASLDVYVAYMDRNSIGNANVLGMSKTLKLSNRQYYNCLTMFFVGYIICMLPANILLRTLSPPVAIGGAVLVFGALVCGIGAAHNYATVLSLRILVGMSQAFIQGLLVYVSLWFKRNEVATVTCVFYSAATLAGAFSGVIAYGTGKNLTKASTGLEPWRWMYIIDGAIAVFVGILTILLLPNFPDQYSTRRRHWLFTTEELNLACERAASYNTVGAKVELIQIWAALKDPKSWAFVWIQSGVATGIGTVGVFLPAFIKEFGYSTLNTQLFTVIPYACAFVTLLAVNIASDRFNKKGPFMLGCVGTVIVGYIILLTDASVPVKIFATCLLTSGLYPSVTLLTSWLSINTGGYTKRAATWAMAEICGQSFSIMGTHVYTDPPRYIQGHSVVLAFTSFAFLNVAALWLWLRHCNKRKERIEEEYRLQGQVHPHASRSLEEEYDQHQNFRYIL